MANQNRTMLQRARWDRLIGALVVLVILIVLIVSGVKSCAKKKEPAEPASTVIPTETTEGTTEAASADNSKAIFLSPSTQEDHLYACDESINEETVMFEIAGKVRALLEADNYKVYVCNEDDSVKNKVLRGNELGCGAYVAIHSNTAGESGKSEGTECYYNKEIKNSKALAENIYNRVAELTPTEDRGLKDEVQRTLYEILTNQYPCCLIEIDFHDNEETSQWILDNEDEIAKAIKDGIVAFLKNKEAGTAPDDTDSGAEEDSAAEDEDSEADEDSATDADSAADGDEE
ncbi:MAG: N-acetylmuramoyl-L-alanine amidase [Oscillospiraceae bacterium]|nr:N-acetylmuramoyl-L-alanine amidase [Oscillospiraceae bacterium]